jgi:hypothetical protein
LGNPLKNVAEIIGNPLKNVAEIVGNSLLNLFKGVGSIGNLPNKFFSVCQRLLKIKKKDSWKGR